MMSRFSLCSLVSFQIICDPSSMQHYNRVHVLEIQFLTHLNMGFLLPRVSLIQQLTLRI
jgi:hypothetical protein